MTGVRTLLLIAATLTTGLMAGLFAAFSYAVMPGLRRADDRTMLVAMQRMNESIINGWFLLCFLGALAFTAAAAATQIGGGNPPVLLWTGLALLFYLAQLLVTFTVNVPLNNRLAGFGDPDALPDPAASRASFEPRWTRWNVVRTVLSTASFAAMVWALVLHGRATG